MDFTESEEQKLIRESVRKLCSAFPDEYWEQHDREGKFPDQYFNAMAEAGWLGIAIPEEYGGAGKGLQEAAIILEEVAASGAAMNGATPVHLSIFGMHPVVKHGSNDMCEKYLPAVAEGKLHVAFGVTEPNAGSDVAGLKTQAIKHANHWVLNGSKMFITNGVYSDLYFVAARTNPDTKGSHGITMFIVEKDTPGFSIGSVLDKMGWHSSDTAELVFENCQIPEENILGEVNQGFYAIMKNFQNERIVLGAQAMGEAAKAIELTLEYALEFINDDELVEVTPTSIRIRKKLLREHERKRASRVA